jgi:dipeptide/tripeptide permease
LGLKPCGKVNDCMALHPGGIPTEFVQAVNPFMILALTPLTTRLWEWQARRGSEPTQITKMGIGAGWGCAR